MRKLTAFDSIDSLFNYIDRNVIGGNLMRNTWVPGDNTSYPPYNIVQLDDNNYRLEVAVAGFSEDQLEVNVDGNALEVRGNQSDKTTSQDRVFLHQGISERYFSRRFTLGEYMEVKEVDLENGILSVNISRNIPDHEKPRKLLITKK